MPHRRRLDCRRPLQYASEPDRGLVRRQRLERVGHSGSVDCAGIEREIDEPDCRALDELAGSLVVLEPVRPIEAGSVERWPLPEIKRFGEESDRLVARPVVRLLHQGGEVVKIGSHRRRKRDPVIVGAPAGSSAPSTERTFEMRFQTVPSATSRPFHTASTSWSSVALPPLAARKRRGWCLSDRASETLRRLACPTP